MVDIEALAQSTDSAILSVGAVCFDPYAIEITDPKKICEDFKNGIPLEGHISCFYKKVSIESCDALGLVIEEDTLKWWSKQNADAINEAFSEEGREPVDKVLRELFLFSRHCTLFWAKSPQYDCTILETAAKRSNQAVAWQYHKLRDVRTIEELSGLDSKDSNSHDALQDSLNQAMVVQKAYNKLGLTRPDFS